MRRSLALAALLLLSTGCVELRDDAAVTPGAVPPQVEGASWRDLPVAYCVPQQPDQGFAGRDTLLRLIDAAFAAWGVPAEREEECPEVIETGNDANQIGWGRLPASAAPAHKAGETSLRYLQLLGGGQTEISEADIVIESQPPPGLDSEECLYATLLHEVGHLLGAPHAAPPAVMAPALSSCPQELTRADLALIEALYPPSE